MRVEVTPEQAREFLRSLREGVLYYSLRRHAPYAMWVIEQLCHTIISEGKGK